MAKPYVYLLIAFDRSMSKEWAVCAFESAEDAEQQADCNNLKDDSPYCYMVKAVRFNERITT